MAEVVLFHHALGLTDPSAVSPPRCARPATPCTRPTSSTAGRSTRSRTVWAIPRRSVGRWQSSTVPGAELFVYLGTDHYFAEHDDQAAALLTQRVLAFLGEAFVERAGRACS